MYRIGVDVGGTNTDSVLIDSSRLSDPVSRGVVAFSKHTTTEDVTSGIEDAVRNVLVAGNVNPSDGRVMSLTIGTTHFINAVLQSDVSRLARVAVIRLAFPYSVDCPPFIDFPSHLRRIMEGHSAIIKGGLQIDGRKIDDLDEDELVAQAAQIRDKKIKNIVIVGVFSPLDVTGLQEYKARDILKREFDEDVNIVCSRDVGQLGYLERENASILNASITTYAQRTIRAFQRAMKRLGLNCPLYITQNDGTLTTAASAAKLPIRTFSSGATNSMRGASFLAGLSTRHTENKNDLILVADIGGTSTDVGVLLPNGFPRQAAKFIEVAGVRTNFSMPDINSIGLGGGSIIRVIDSSHVTVGPDSVGHFLTRDARVFGGQVLTATDIVSRTSSLAIGDPTHVSDLNDATLRQAEDIIKRKLESAVDRMKTNPEDCTLLLVGGGSILAPKQLNGVDKIIQPPFHSVANAVGAALTSVSGEIDTIEILQGKAESLGDRLRKIEQEAIHKAVENGAQLDTVKIVSVDVLPIQYVTNQATRIIVKAVGELGPYFSENIQTGGLVPTDVRSEEEDTPVDQHPSEYKESEQETESIDYEHYRPKVINGEWILSETDLLFIMEGCGVLGCGGGGSPYPSYLVCRQILRDGGVIRIADHSSLPDSAFLMRGGSMGSPSVGSERLRISSSVLEAGRELAKYCGLDQFVGTLCDEIGGGNGMESLKMSHFYRVPALDGDLMGRAFPMLNQVLPSVYERPNALIPCALCDGNGNVVLLTKVKSEHQVETIMRTVTTEMGSSAALCPPPIAVSDARDYGVPGSQSLAWRIGRAIVVGRQKNNIPGIPNAILQLQNGKYLFVGKITGVSREVRAGFTWGEVEISRLVEEEMDHGIDPSSSILESAQKIIIPFQNENLCAYLEHQDGSRTVAAIVPDLIVVLDSQSGSHLGTQDYSYGLRATVIALAGTPLWKSDAGLKTGGPGAFGLRETYVPVAEYRIPKSVTEEYAASHSNLYQG